MAEYLHCIDSPINSMEFGGDLFYFCNASKNDFEVFTEQELETHIHDENFVSDQDFMSFYVYTACFFALVLGFKSGISR